MHRPIDTRECDAKSVTMLCECVCHAEPLGMTSGFERPEPGKVIYIYSDATSLEYEPLTRDEAVALCINKGHPQEAKSLLSIDAKQRIILLETGEGSITGWPAGTLCATSFDEGELWVMVDKTIKHAKMPIVRVTKDE